MASKANAGLEWINVRYNNPPRWPSRHGGVSIIVRYWRRVINKNSSLTAVYSILTGFGKGECYRNYIVPIRRDPFGTGLDGYCFLLTDT